MNNKVIDKLMSKSKKSYDDMMVDFKENVMSKLKSREWRDMTEDDAFEIINGEIENWKLRNKIGLQYGVDFNPAFGIIVDHSRKSITVMPTNVAAYFMVVSMSLDKSIKIR